MKFYASFIRSSVTFNDLYIHFGTGTTRYEELLRVPIAAPGELDKRPLIRITVGMNPPVADNDPIIGITDGTNHNQFQLIEQASSSTGHVDPCEAYNGIDNGRSGPAGDPVAGAYTLLFDPSRRFGSCATNNGFNSDARFNSQIDLTKGLSLVVHRDQTSEEYNFHYFLVEFL